VLFVSCFFFRFNAVQSKVPSLAYKSQMRHYLRLGLFVEFNHFIRQWSYELLRRTKRKSFPTTCTKKCKLVLAITLLGVVVPMTVLCLMWSKMGSMPETPFLIPPAPPARLRPATRPTLHIVCPTIPRVGPSSTHPILEAMDSVIGTLRNHLMDGTVDLVCMHVARR